MKYKEAEDKDWFTSGEISWEEYWNDPSWEEDDEGKEQDNEKKNLQNRFEKISEQELEKVLNDVFWEFFWMPKLKQDILNNNNTTLKD